MAELFNQDLWRQVHAVGIEGLEIVSEYEWNFSNLDNAFQEGGVLHGKRVYLFSSIEPQLLSFDGQRKVTCIPTVVAIVSPSPSSDEIAVLSWHRREQILHLRELNMEWVPYTLPGQRVPVEPQIFIMSCFQRRADLQDFILLPYLYSPLLEDEQSRKIKIIYPSEPEPFECEVDWEIEDYVEEIFALAIVQNKLSEDCKDDFEEYVRKRVGEERPAKLEERQNRMIARASEIAAIQNNKFYKFYPVHTADTPNISEWKCPFINRFYGRAHQVF